MSRFLSLGNYIIDARAVIHIVTSPTMKFTSPDTAQEYRTYITNGFGHSITIYSPVSEYRAFIDKFFIIRDRRDFIEYSEADGLSGMNEWLVDISRVTMVNHVDTRHGWVIDLTFGSQGNRISIPCPNIEMFEKIRDQFVAWKSTPSSRENEIFEMLQALVYAPGGPMAQKLEKDFFSRTSSSCNFQAGADGEM